MKIININLGKDIKELHIIPISDVHIGDKLTNLKLLKECLRRIKEEENTYTIINGDFCNTALKNSKSDVYSDSLSPSQQLDEMIELLMPIKEKILVFSGGNHEVFENQLVNQFPSQLKNLKSRESIKLQAESPLRGKAHCSKHT